MPVKDIRSKRSRVHASLPCSTRLILSLYRGILFLFLSFLPLFHFFSCDQTARNEGGELEKGLRVPILLLTSRSSLLEGFDAFANGTLIPRSPLMFRSKLFCHSFLSIFRYVTRNITFSFVARFVDNLWFLVQYVYKIWLKPSGSNIWWSQSYGLIGIARFTL